MSFAVPRHIPTRRALRASTIVTFAILLSGCARELRPATAGDVARIRAACPPGSFAAAMASNCPEIAR